MWAFKWDTVWHCTLRVIGNTRGQSWNFSICLIKTDFLGIFDFDLLYFRCPLRYSVIQYLIGKLQCLTLRRYKVQGRGSTFRVCHAHLKNAILLHSSLVAGVSFFPRLYMNINVCIHSDKKIPDRSRFFEENFDGFWSFSQKVSKIQKSYIPHWKALIFSFLEV